MTLEYDVTVCKIYTQGMPYLVSKIMTKKTHLETNKTHCILTVYEFFLWFTFIAILRVCIAHGLWLGQANHKHAMLEDSGSSLKPY